MERDARVLFLLHAVLKDDFARPVTIVPEEEYRATIVTCYAYRTDAELNPDQVKATRKDEINYDRPMGAFTAVPVAEAWKATGKAPLRCVGLTTTKEMHLAYIFDLAGQRGTTPLKSTMNFMQACRAGVSRPCSALPSWLARSNSSMASVVCPGGVRYACSGDDHVDI